MRPDISRNELVNKIKLSLGWPSINLELEQAHFELAVDLSVQQFQRFAYGEGVRYDFLLINVSAGTSAYSVPSSVVNYLAPDYADPSLGDTSQLFTFENYMWNMGALNVWQWGSFGLVTYELAMQQLELIRKMIVSKYSVLYNKEESTITIYPPPATTTVLFSPVYVTVPASSLYDNDWVFMWAKAECMEMLGHIRNKFSTLPGPGGSVQFGEDMLNSAKQLKDQLRERLQTEYEPPMFFWA